ncbi:hypothetical protein RRG08_028593 [Elysia crispata]|uniref:Uncharacterized protein n=1 Tax=Elysia crispata TaxID=231223 RepID=A0AAE0ZTW8_9GAST|nr:hypothetical protein RRG08_028593 [Elysia crispata]
MIVSSKGPGERAGLDLVTREHLRVGCVSGMFGVYSTNTSTGTLNSRVRQKVAAVEVSTNLAVDHVRQCA